MSCYSYGMLCQIKDCKNNAYRIKSGKCVMHYTRFKRYGTYERKTGHPNKIIIGETYASIVLHAGRKCLISLEDIDKVKNKVWSWGTSNGVVHTWQKDNKTRHIKIHRFILDVPKGKVVDHKNGNRLDNRRENLRIVEQWENMINRKSAPLRNITKSTSGKYYIKINKNNKSYYFGTYETLEEAIKIRDVKANEIHGDLRLR